MKINKKKIIVISLVLLLVITTIIVCLLLNNKAKQIKEIYVASLPEKTEYFLEEKLEIKGLKVCALQNNGKSLFLNSEELEISGFDSTSITEKQIITIKYRDFTCTFNISITEPPQLVPTLIGIELVTLPKVVYKIGEKLDTDNGILKLNYSNGQSLLVMLINSYVYGFTTDEIGVYTLTIRYTENNVLQETTYTITVEK